VLLGEAEDRRHPPGKLPGGDLLAQEAGELLMQQYR